MPCQIICFIHSWGWTSSGQIIFWGGNVHLGVFMVRLMYNAWQTYHHHSSQTECAANPTLAHGPSLPALWHGDGYGDGWTLTEAVTAGTTGSIADTHTTLVASRQTGRRGAGKLDPEGSPRAHRLAPLPRPPPVDSAALGGSRGPEPRASSHSWTRP